MSEKEIHTDYLVTIITSDRGKPQVPPERIKQALYDLAPSLANEGIDMLDAIVGVVGDEGIA